MISLELFFLPAIILLGIVTSYQDFKFGKIKNKWIILALTYAFIVYVIGILFYYFYGELNIEYMMELSTNILFAILIGFGFWIAGIWTAGDGKLFIAYSALIPLSVYSLGFQKYIPCTSLLINIFVLAFIIIFFNLIFRIKLKNFKKISLNPLKKSFELKRIMSSVIMIFAILWIVEIFLSFININNSLVKIILMMLVLFLIPKKYENKIMYFLFVFVILRLIIDESVYTLSFLINFMSILFIWVFFRSFLINGIDIFGQEIFSKEISINNLKSGMILNDMITKINKKDLEFLKKEGNAKITKYKGQYYSQNPKSFLCFNNFIDEESEGVTKEQINLIKKIGIKTIKISQTIPFALFMFAGVLLTLIIKGSILAFIKGIF